MSIEGAPVQVDEFAGAIDLGYLRVLTGEPDSGPRVCRWRSRCRKLGQASISVAVRGSRFDLEVRAPINLEARIRFEQLSCHPTLRHRGGGGSSESGVYLKGLRLSNFNAAIDAVKSIVATCGSQEMRQALRREQSPLAPVEEDPHVVRGVAHYYQHDSPAVAVVRMRLDQREYDCWSAGLAHLYDCLPKPIPMLVIANFRRSSEWQQPHRLEERFVGLCRTVEAARESWVGLYHLEPRFTPGLVSLTVGQEARREVTISRPAFSEDGRESVFRLWGPGLTQTMSGLVRMEKAQSGWRFVEFSFDEDWDPVGFDRDSLDEDSSPQKFPGDWKLTAPPYGKNDSNEFFEPGTRPANDALFVQLASGEGPTELLDQPVIPMLDGRKLALRRLLAEIREQGEVLYDTTGDFKMSVIRFEGAQWLGKLLAHLADQWPCRRASRHYIVAKPRSATNREQSVLDLLERILRRAEFPYIRCQLADLSYHPFAFQPTGKELSVTESPKLFRQPGTLWIRDLNAMRFEDSPYRLLAHLCLWAECEGAWSDRLWHSAAIECAWSDTRREL